MCGVASVLTGPATPPAGAVVVPTGVDSTLAENWTITPNTTYYFTAGMHTLGSGKYTQIQPADGDTFIGAPGAILDGGRNNLYAFTGQATNVTIEYLTIQNFGPPGSNQGAGVVNHDSGSNWTIQYNTITNSAGAGLFLGSNNVARYNCLSDNGEYGFQVYGNATGAFGVSNVVMNHNEITGNNTWNWEAKDPGCGCSGGGKFWNATGVTVTNNWSHANHGPGFWADTDDNDFEFENNLIEKNDDEGIMYEISYNATIENNTFNDNGLVAGPTNPGFPTGAIYLSESGGDSRVPARYSSITITGNTFTNNWAGVILWENSNRFCGSPANTSSSFCTLVNPSVVNLTTCVPGTIENAPYINDCRWKTQNVLVTHNVFSLNASEVAGCTMAVGCGSNGIFSEYATTQAGYTAANYPYPGTMVEYNITFNQNNVFADNTYIGPWDFMALAQGDLITASQWQAAPYNQDAGSSF